MIFHCRQMALLLLLTLLDETYFQSGRLRFGASLGLMNLSWVTHQSLVIFIHDQPDFGETPFQLSQICGFACFNIWGYRLRSEGHFWPAQLEDCQLALQMMRHDATQMGFQASKRPGHMCIWHLVSHRGFQRCSKPFYILGYLVSLYEWDI